MDAFRRFGRAAAVLTVVVIVTGLVGLYACEPLLSVMQRDWEEIRQGAADTGGAGDRPSDGGTAPSQAPAADDFVLGGTLTGGRPGDGLRLYAVTAGGDPQSPILSVWFTEGETGTELPDGPPAYTATVADYPPRVRIDLQGVRWGPPVRELPSPHPLVGAVAAFPPADDGAWQLTVYFTGPVAVCVQDLTSPGAIALWLKAARRPRGGPERVWAVRLLPEAGSGSLEDAELETACALAARARAAGAGGAEILLCQDPGFWAVEGGAFPEREEATALADRLRAAGLRVVVLERDPSDLPPTAPIISTDSIPTTPIVDDSSDDTGDTTD